MTDKHPRINREEKTIDAMVTLYCRHNHQAETLCQKCRDLRQYALECLKKCPFQEGKTTCLKCPVHCYKPEMREKIRAVMRYSGPKMVYRHPVLAILHFLDRCRNKPVVAIK